MAHLEHIGIAVEDPGAVAGLLERLLGRAPYKRERVDHDGVQTHFISAATVKLELLEAVGPSSPVARFLARRGEGLHHLAFEVDDVEAQLERVRALGLTPLGDAPRAGADGKRIFFVHPAETHGVLLEFCQAAPRLPEATPVPWRGGRLAGFAFGYTGGRPVLVLPPIGGSTAADTEPLLRLLEPQVAVRGLDFAGHGASDAFPALPLTLDTCVDNVRAGLDAFGLDEAHLVGCGTGGLVALAVAARYPDRIDQLACLGTPGRWTAAVRAALLRRARLATAADPERAASCLASCADGLPGLAESVRRPVLVVAADRDDAVPLSSALALHRAVAGSRLAVIPGDAPVPGRASPDALVSLLVRHFVPQADQPDRV